MRPKTKGQRQSSQTATRRTKKICLVRGAKLLQSVVLISVGHSEPFYIPEQRPGEFQFPARLLR